MSSPSRAMGWEFRRRHRWGFLGVAAYLLVLAPIKLVVAARGLQVHLESAESFAFAFVVPLAAAFTYFLAVFSYGLDGDLTARQSMYPARMFTRPVTTTALAGWPMFYGTLACALLWLTSRWLVLWPPEWSIPFIWPALLAASLLAWLQAFMWLPYGLPGLRLVIAVLWMTSIDAIVMLALYFKASEPVMLAILAPHVPLAYLVARYAVVRARRGDVPDWSGRFAWLARADGSTSRRSDFRSPVSAQTWLEWRRSGRSLPTWVAAVLPAELLLLWVAGTSMTLVVVIVVGALLTPVIMAVFAAPAAYGLLPFIATRPLTNAQLIAAKLTMTIRSTVIAWLVVLVAIPIALELSGTAPMVVDRSRAFAAAVGTPRAIVFVVLLVGGCIVSTWKQLVQSLYIGLTGRAGLVKGSVFVTLTLLFLAGPIGEWIADTGRVGALWSALPLIFAVLVCLKIAAAAWIVTRLFRTRLLSDRALVTGAACWCVAVLALYGVLVWLLDTPHIPDYLLMLLAILAVPLARLSAAPLALAWNRHR